MPGFVAVPDAAQVNVAFTLNGEFVNCRHVFTKAGFVQADIEALANTVAQQWDDTLMDALSNKLTRYGVGVSGLRAIDDIFAFINAEPPVVGGDSSAGLPNEVAFCVTTLTGRRGRGGTGRFYVPGMTTATRQNENNVTAEFAALCVDLATSIRLATAALGWVWVVPHVKLNGVELNPRTTTPIISERYTDTLYDSQRSRKPGNGR